VDTPSPAVAVLATTSTVVEHEIVRSLEEMVFETATDVLGKAGLTIADIDAIVISGNDETDGRVISIMAGTGPAGGVGRDTTLVASAGDHALIYGYLRVLAGQGPRVLVLGWAKPSEAVDPNHAELVEAEPYLLRRTGMNHTVSAALQAGRWLDAPTGEGPVVAWPLTRADLPRRGDSVHGAVLAAEGSFEPGTEKAWIHDCGWATSTYELGARDLSRFDSLEAALAQIARRGTTGPEGWDAVEIGAESEPAVRAAADSLGLPSGATVNASGALSEVLTAPHVTGLGRMMAAIRAVADAETPTTSAGIGFHGFAGQGATVAVFGTTKKGVAA
jgi:hypothetical protein